MFRRDLRFHRRSEVYHFPPACVTFPMQITKFNQLKERCHALKTSLFGTIDAKQVTASVDPNLASMIYAARAKISAMRAAKYSPNAATPTTPPAAATTVFPAGYRSSEDLLAELNSIQDPGDQTVWWREHYAEIKRAQWREVYARAQARAQGEERFLNIRIPKQKQ
jgi:hypothetical protein